jgi:hypothetical protein
MPNAKIQPDQLSTLTMEALSKWFVETYGPGELNLNRTLASYGMTKSDVGQLSKSVVAHVERGTGQKVRLPANWAAPYFNAPVAHYALGATAELMTALPGDSGTIPTGPILTLDAMSKWFVRQGKITNADKLDFNRTLSSYGLKRSDLAALSKVVVARVAKEAGYNVELPVNWSRQYLDSPVGHFAAGVTAHVMDALPGEPGTIPNGPIETT